MGIGRWIQAGPTEISLADWLALLGKKVPFHRNVRLAAGCRQLLQAALPSHGIGQRPSCHAWGGLVTDAPTKFPFLLK